MVKKLVCVAIFASLLAACEGEVPAQQRTNDSDIIKTTATEFSYVTDLPVEKREHYHAFLHSGDMAV